MRAQVLNLLLSGASRATILQTVDISAAALDEILEDAEFVKALDSAREARREEAIENRYGKLELQLLERVQGHISEIYDTPNLCRLLETVARTRQLRKTPTAMQQNANHYGNPTVGIKVNIPVFLNSGVVLDSNSQVVAVDGRNMAPLPTEQVYNLFSTLENATKEHKNERKTDPILADLARESQAGRTQEATSGTRSPEAAVS